MTARRFSRPARVIDAATDRGGVFIGLSAARLDTLNEMARGTRLGAVSGFPRWRYRLGPDSVQERDVAELARRGLITRPSLGTLGGEAPSIPYALAAMVRDILAPRERQP